MLDSLWQRAVTSSADPVKHCNVDGWLGRRPWDIAEVEGAAIAWHVAEAIGDGTKVGPASIFNFVARSITDRSSVFKTSIITSAAFRPDASGPR